MAGSGTVQRWGGGRAAGASEKVYSCGVPWTGSRGRGQQRGELAPGRPLRLLSWPWTALLPRPRQGVSLLADC